MEIWKDIPQYPKYQASNEGRIRNKNTEYVLKPHIDDWGYQQVRVSKGTVDTGRSKTVHRLVASAFIDGDHTNLQVNHKDGNKTNNHIDNLEFVTGSENVKHAYDTGIRKPSGGRGPIRKIRIVETGQIFDNMAECAKFVLGDNYKYGNSSAICRCVNDPTKTCKGFHYEAVEDDMDRKPMYQPFLRDYQMDAVKRMKNGCILNGGTGSGKSRTGLYYYFSKYGGSFDPDYKPMRPNPPDLYIITTAKKRNTLEWEEELVPFLLYTDPGKNSYYGNKVIVDSWQNIKKYEDVKNAFWIFDEDHVTGKGAWVKAFLKIAKFNEWIILSATPGDQFSDFVPVFIANGFFKNRSEFERNHVVYSRFSKYPKIEKYLDTDYLMYLREKILVDMDFERSTIQHHEDVFVKYDVSKYKDVIRNRWNPFTNEPIINASEFCSVLRRIVNSDESRQIAILELFEHHPKVIIFYNHNFELEILKNIFSTYDDVIVAEYNGRQHDSIPVGDKWVYLVQYNASEAWNCITTDTVIFYSQTYSYKTMIQAAGRIDRMNTPFKDLYYYHIRSRSGIDLAISKALREKKTFNESRWAKF